MYQLLAYFFFNLIGFLVFYLIWLKLDKPDPYDYTTIAGLKCEDLLLTKSAIVLPVATPINTISSSKGNLAEIQELGSVEAFFKWLHATYGTLAAFYWGPRYVVSVGSMELANALKQYQSSLKQLNPLLYASILFGCPDAWNSSSKNECKQKTGDCSKEAANQQATLFMNYYDSTIDVKELLVCNTKWVKGPLCLVFDCEIELDAHPIPANIPILLNMDLLTNNSKTEQFKWILDRCFNK
ncbi:hypothetical protein M3Y97_00838800 [Aphelenchoides bicaudatus]|nr:hypothetical protein M3Y97_00838800 [Aphelenchoides bicaudatus]